MQEGFGGRGGWWDVAGVEVGGIQAVVPAIRRVIERARAVGTPVVYLRMDLEGAEVMEDARMAHYYEAVRSGRQPAAGGLPRGVRQSDIVAALAPLPGDLVIEKPTYDGFHETDLDDRLRALGAKTLVFTGCTTSICVESTLRSAAFRDYDCLLLEDCCAEPIGHQFARSNHDATVLQIELLLGWVTSSRAFLSAVQSAAA